jgi:hypothetical protein
MTVIAIARLLLRALALVGVDVEIGPQNVAAA